MNKSRKSQAFDIRVAAAELALSRVHPAHKTNGDEQKFRGKPSKNTENSKKANYLASFTKGMPHSHNTGLVDKSEDFQQFIIGIDSGDPDAFKKTRLGPKAVPFTSGWVSDKAKKFAKNLRGWESPSSGLTFDLEGPDSASVTMPPAPAIGSQELIGEMGEVYAQALLRDVPFTEIVNEVETYLVKSSLTGTRKDIKVKQILAALKALPWFSGIEAKSLSSEEKKRVRNNINGQSFF